MDEADMAVYRFTCTYGISKVALCPPATAHYPLYFFAKYPQETTKIWNLTKLLTPTSWTWTFTAIVSIVIMLKCFTLVGIYLGCSTTVQDITLVPFRWRGS